MLCPWRSRLFWLGLVPLVLLLWAWWDSRSTYAWVGHEWNDAGIYIGYGDGVWDLNRYAFDGLGDRRFVAGRTGIIDDPFAPEHDLPMIGLATGPTGWGRAWVDIWLVTLGYAVVFLGTLGGWQRRKRRSAAAGTVGPVDR